MKRPGHHWLAMLLAALLLGCGSVSPDDIHNPVNKNICQCTPKTSLERQYREKAKHVPLPNQTPVETTVATILAWPQPPPPAQDAPRTGREKQLFHIQRAFLQFAQIHNGDCDIHFEISDNPDAGAPRMIVETTNDPEFCQARQTIKSELAKAGFRLTTFSGELPQPVPVSVLGLAFEDAPHNRGTSLVQTLWELHPAIVQAIQP